MTVEQTKLIAIPMHLWEKEFAAFAQQAERAAARYAKAPLGNRREALRYEALCRALERLVVLSIARWDQWDLDDESVRHLDARWDSTADGFRHPWSLSGRDVCKLLKGRNFTGLKEADSHARLFELRQPFEVGPTVMAIESPRDNIALQPPAEVWKAPTEVWKAAISGQRVRAAMEARWRDQLEAAVANKGGQLVPSGVNNQVLCEGLREFAVIGKRQKTVQARIVYRDGSEAPPFPLRSVKMKDNLNSDLPILRVALMSMRHPEMDASVDAAWLRNSQVSVARPAAETDRFVYETSRIQLRELATAYECGVCLHVYQTGLEPTVVGFYRAVHRAFARTRWIDRSRSCFSLGTRQFH